MNPITKTFTLPNRREVSIETGKLAKQADGSVVVKMGNTMLLATVVSNKTAGENIDFLPLTVDYREKFSATGKFPGGFLKRENRLSDSEILVSRLIDRALRPLFPEDYHAETQVQVMLISADVATPPDALACLAASAAIMVSDVPFNGPVSEVRVARINGKLEINPDFAELPTADIDLIVAGTTDSIMMVEGEMKEVSENEMMEAINYAHEEIKKQCAVQKELESLVQKALTKREYCHEKSNEELKSKIHTFAYEKCYEIAKKGLADKHKRAQLFNEVKEAFIASLNPDEASENAFLINQYFHATEKEAVRNVILSERTRLDGRKLNEIRPIWSEVDYLPGAHGSAIFTRGETQSLTTVTLGTKRDEQSIDGAVVEGSEKFILHYNFPSFSTGEARPNRGPGRREIGHGNLALRALKPVVPFGVLNPYTVRIVSDILESNGSSSMATVCAGTLALMDAGVQISAPVSGIAMGLITDENSGKYAVLSDILGDEDHLGDMDFKVTGTEKGITACQMDIKVKGLSSEIMSEALKQAKEGRLHILNEICKTMKTPNSDYKPHVPRIIQLTIPKDMIGAVIGPGGKVIQGIQEETQTTIVIEEVNGMGVIDIVSANKENSDAALARIKGIVAVPEVGEVYRGKVKNIAAFGAFVEILPGKDGLLHISEIEWRRLDKVEEVLKEGDVIDVKLIGVDPKTGKFKLSRKVLLEKPSNHNDSVASN
ncbi:MAG: polyribonucleotide nucleotidyltransferase [Bacteroidetes bacterium]|nr:polyribonucleotide nucleotidyltransferase [Bacteroidota bacterium]MBV6462475.1 Polyribonucleotide nucleotidyltransferase [Flavobacteriales bacterium]MCL4817021.1 polyribonucleotide nucleotidyltransferase [Flavobacteriales bacterium]NOG94700.1 polyribonucleotide nucleotidyltransferase [Bacteroidota bacterium]WKZ74359.1 MAG: polyribonucleotide nucleotidyltransferase [Vicingaceae bacterium]